MVAYRVLKQDNTPSDRIAFKCPGCNEIHMISDAPGAWTFNGDFEKPTIRASVLVRGGHYAPGWVGPNCWCNWKERYPDDETSFKCTQCHSFVTDGMIEFLSDCSHELAGKTVPLLDFDAEK